MSANKDMRGWGNLFLTGILFIFFACGGSQGLRTTEEKQQYEALVNLVESREFEIVNDWANPQRGNSISLIGNPNFIRFKGDSVDIFLPYFGVRYSGGSYGTGGGIEYNGPLQNLRVEKRERQGDLLLKFEGKQNNEQLQFLINLYPNEKANTTVTTSQRSSINYRGEIVK